MHIGPAELRAFAGKRPISLALRRMATRENAKHVARSSVPRPCILSLDEDGFYRAEKQRLKQLQNRPCPLCGEPLEFDRISLFCPSGHGWSNPSVAEEEIGLTYNHWFHGGSLPASSEG